MNIEDLGQCEICDAVLMGPGDVHMAWHRDNDIASGTFEIEDHHEVHHVTPGSEPGAVVDWLTGHGYWAVAAGGLPGSPGGWSGMGVVFGRGNEPARVAGVGGTTLVWDGESVRVWAP